MRFGWHLWRSYRVEQKKYLTLREADEYSIQCDALLAKYSIEVLEPDLERSLMGIATNPQAYDRTTWNTRQARSRPAGLTVPIITIVFQIQNEGLEDEHVLLLWIDEMSTASEILEAGQ